MRKWMMTEYITHFNHLHFHGDFGAYAVAGRKVRKIMANKKIEIKFSYGKWGATKGFAIAVFDKETNTFIKATVIPDPEEIGIRFAQQASVLMFDHVCRDILGLDPNLERQKLMQQFMAETNGTDNT
jgi:hypothetical protein